MQWVISIHDLGINFSFTVFYGHKIDVTVNRALEVLVFMPLYNIYAYLTF